MSDLLYRKKPVIIEAMQFQPVGSSGEDAARVELWCGGEMVVDNQGYCLIIETLEGRMRALPGDWIIKGVAGEFYPCRPDIFEKTYEPAALPAVQPDAREAALQEALAEINAKWRSGADTPDEMRGLALAEAAILDLIDKPGHVNEPPKSEHEAEVMLTPATKGGA